MVTASVGQVDRIILERYRGVISDFTESADSSSKNIEDNPVLTESLRTGETASSDRSDWTNGKRIEVSAK
jgi:hypothetical protein